MSTREKNQKEWARNFEIGRENCQKSGKKWARKPIFAREKSQNKTKKPLLGQKKTLYNIYIYIYIYYVYIFLRMVVKYYKQNILLKAL